MKRAVILVAAAVIALGGIALWSPSSQAQGSMIRNAATGKLRPRTLPVQGGTKVLPFLSGGAISTAQEALAGSGSTSAAASAASGGDLGIAPNSLGCRNRNPDGDVRVNQDCFFRRQAEEDIAFNPTDRNNLLIGSNDSRIGWNQTSFAFSTDNGRHWGDEVFPLRYRLNAPEDLTPTKQDPNRHTIRGNPGDLHAYDVCSDPAEAFDSQGRAFISCVAFNNASPASALFVTTSPAGAKASYFDQIPPPFGLVAGYTGREHIVAEDNTLEIAHDKEFITADTYKASPNTDNVYVTWTVFVSSAQCQGGTPEVPAVCESPIYGSMSTDHGFTWSTPEQISGANRQLCVLGNALNKRANPNACNFDQGSDPAVLPNGDLVVSFVNGNTPTVNQQILAVNCRPRGSSPAGTAHLNCGTPSKVGDELIENAPRCDFGRGPEQCIPGNFVRAPFETSQRIAVNERNGNLFVTWFDYRHNEFDIFLSRSTDGGRTWSRTRQVNPDRGMDHYFSAIDVGEAQGSSHVGVSYYRTGRVPNENTTPPDGFQIGQPGVGKKLSDYVLAGGLDLSTPYAFQVVSPKFPPPDGIQAGFIGDYSGLVVNRGEEAHPAWADTRNRVPNPGFNKVTVDEDAYTTARPLPG
jgi:hypothetical protein